MFNQLLTTDNISNSKSVTAVVPLCSYRSLNNVALLKFNYFEQFESYWVGISLLSREIFKLHLLFKNKQHFIVSNLYMVEAYAFAACGFA